MTLGRCSNGIKVWRQWMLAAGIGCVVVATSLPTWAQVPPVPAVPDPPVDAAADAATDVDAVADPKANVDAATDAATNVDADAATNVEARAENPANATTQADAAAEAATDAAPAAVNAQGNLDADVDADADTQAPRLQGDAAVDVDADADIRNRRGGATDAQIGLDTQTRFGAAADVQDGRLILGNVASESLAARAGLRASDEIVSINGTQVRTRAAYDRALRGAGGPAAIQYRRGGQLYTANVDLPPVPPQRQQSFYRGADAVQSGNAMQKHGSPVQKGGSYSNGPVQKGYYSDAGCGGGHRGHHRHGHRQRRGYR